MAQQDELITKAIDVLAAYPPEDEQRPATVAFFADTEFFFRGNRDGYVKLAIAALRAAQGELQKFDKRAKWFHNDDEDWQVAGLEPDESAHVYQPPKRTRTEGIRATVILLIVLVAIFACIGVGAVTIVHWIFK